MVLPSAVVSAPPPAIAPPLQFSVVPVPNVRLLADVSVLLPKLIVATALVKVEAVPNALVPPPLNESEPPPGPVKLMPVLKVWLVLKFSAAPEPML